ncbi:MAG: alpha/beta hydrolase [Clostridia bacterium]|nr:alpha/beta hydrolase [Clostridia bacterium]
MNSVQAFLESRTNEEPIYVRMWLPDGEAAAVIQLVHGMAEHIGRYADFAMFLASRGYAVVGHDHAGHGQSMLNSAHEGVLADSHGWERLIDDTRTVFEYASGLYAGKPYMLFGHSMGSMVLRSYMMRYSDADGFIICGTCGRNPAIGMARLLAKLQIARHGAAAKGAFLDKLAFGGYNKRWTEEGDPLSWLSANVENRRRYEADPRCGFLFTNGAFLDMFDGIKEISSPAWARSAAHKPILLIAGADDPVGSFGDGVKQVNDALLAAGHEVTFKLYAGMRHEILNEDGNEEVYGDVLDFADAVTRAYEV